MELHNIGKRIAALRKQKGWSQAELAKQLNVSDKAISKWENGGTPGIDLFPKLAELFNVSIDYLMLGENKIPFEDGTIEEKSEDETEATSNSEQDDTESELAKFLKTIENMSTEELYIILTDQRDLYTKDEFDIIQKRFNTLISSPPTGSNGKNNMQLVENTQPDPYCINCQNDIWGLSLTAEQLANPKRGESGTETSGCLAYLIALLIPFVGLIWGCIKKDTALIGFSIIIYVITFLYSLAFCLS